MCAIDFDDNSLNAVDAAGNIARQSDGTMALVHVVPQIIQPGLPLYVDFYKGQEEEARRQLRKIVDTRLTGVKCEILVQNGEPAPTILKLARKTEPDLLVIATHGRKGFSHFFIGSVAELILRGAQCPVLTVRAESHDENTVAGWMTPNPVTASLKESLCSVRSKMLDGGFHYVPVIEGEKVISIISDRDVEQGLAQRNEIKVSEVVPKDKSETITVVAPTTSLKEAVRQFRKLKVKALPVVDQDKLVGIITTSDFLRAFTEAV